MAQPVRDEVTYLRKLPTERVQAGPTVPAAQNAGLRKQKGIHKTSSCGDTALSLPRLTPELLGQQHLLLVDEFFGHAGIAHEARHVIKLCA